MINTHHSPATFPAFPSIFCSAVTVGRPQPLLPLLSIVSIRPLDLWLTVTFSALLCSVRVLLFNLSETRLSSHCLVSLLIGYDSGYLAALYPAIVFSGSIPLHFYLGLTTTIPTPSIVGSYVDIISYIFVD